MKPSQPLRDSIPDLQNATTIGELVALLQALPQDSLIFTGLEASPYLSNFVPTIKEIKVASMQKEVGRVFVLQMGDESPLSFIGRDVCIPTSEE
jgi:hypothetical protein